MTDVKACRWHLLCKLPDGHKYFRDVFTGRIAVADESGYYPDETDDGILYVDHNRPITFSQASIPVVSADGKQSRTIACGREAQWVRDTLTMKIVGK